MEKLAIVISLVSMVALFSCGSSESSTDNSSEVETSGSTTSITADEGSARLDSDTELQSGIQGLNVGDIYILDGENNKISGSEVALNSKFSIVYEGVKNYTLKDGKAFPGLSIMVMDGNQNMVINETDLYASNSDGLTEEDASVLRAPVTVAEPLKAGQYMCTIQVVDKNNTNAYIMSTWSFDVK